MMPGSEGSILTESRVVVVIGIVVFVTPAVGSWTLLEDPPAGRPLQQTGALWMLFPSSSLLALDAFSRLFFRRLRVGTGGIVGSTIGMRRIRLPWGSFEAVSTSSLLGGVAVKIRMPKSWITARIMILDRPSADSLVAVLRRRGIVFEEDSISQ